MPELPPADRHLPEVSRQRWPLSENGRALHAAAPPSREFGLKDLFAVVRRHVPLVLAITGVFLLAAILIALREQPTYTSAAVVRLAEDRHTVTTGDQELVLDDERAKIANPIQTQLELLQSRSVVGPVVESEGLRVRWQSDSLSGAKAPVVRLRSDTAADTVFVTFRPKDVVAQGLKARARAAYGDTVRLGDIGLLAHARPAGVDTATLVVLSEQDAVDALMLQLH
ncbi:MAG TPA: Wzz/FepE/Etk N-terminal domain-containing protein, partial [Gemmatimonadaceae bacterium]|nr:Wzz/FepE/Etk N-terminal domain-containing protein [Gemmatimonadaceae bacterium]